MKYKYQKYTHTQTNKHNFCFNTLLLSDNYWPVTFITHKKYEKIKQYTENI